MPKKQQHFSWRQARDDELGFMAATDPTDFAENSEAGNQRRNVMGNSRNPNLIVEPPRNSNSIGEQPRHQNQIVEPPPNMHSHTEPRGHQHDSLRNEVTVNRIQANDELYIAPSEHPGMCLTADSFDGRNFHIWCRAVKRGLISRNKLRIIDSSIPPPRADSVDYMQWLKVDYLVFNWISNSMNKEIARGFQHLDTSSQLWDELYKRFGSRNGPRLYQLRREIATYSQQNQSVMLYFNNLISLWDDLALLKNSRVCTCEAATDATTDLEEEHLMQFLMGLQDCYETVKQQILVMHPLPNVSQAYARILQVEEQINVSNHLAGGIDHTALYSNQKPYRGEPYKKRLSKEEKAKLRCEHCGGSGHVKSDCFDLIGVPEWYKKYRNDKGKGRAHYAAKKEDEGKSVDETEVRSQMDLSADTISGVSKLIQMQTDLARQFQQMFRKGPKWEDSAAEGPPNLANLAELDLGSSSIDFKEGGHYAFGVSTAITNEEWIVDSGASHHMSCNIGLLTDMKRLKHPLQVFLPDGSSVWVFLAGEANLNRDITLHNVLFAPSFTHNLLSVGQLAKELGGKVQFLASHCIIQRLNSEAVLGICKMKKYLYVFPQQPVVSCIANIVEIGSEILELHRLLGHPSLTTMKHIMSGKKRLHPFGCLTFKTDVVPHKVKFDTRGDKCIFLGVSSQHKGYILYNLSFENSYTPTDYVSDGIPTQESSLSGVDQPVSHPTSPEAINTAPEEIVTDISESELDTQHSVIQLHRIVFSRPNLTSGNRFFIFPVKKMEAPSSVEGHVIEVCTDDSPTTERGSGGSKACKGAVCGFSDAKTSSKDVQERSASMKKLLIAVVLCVVFMSVEVFGGIKANSLAILTDAAHLLSDVASFAISLFSLWAAGWEATPRQSYGFFRIEILGALVSIQLIWLLTGILVYEAIVRLIQDTGEVQGFLMFLVSAFGLLVNIIMAVLLGHDHGHGHSHDHGHGHAHDHGHSHDHGHHEDHDHGSEDDHMHNHGVTVTWYDRSEQGVQKHDAHGADHSEPLLAKPEGGNKKKPRNINIQGAYLHILGDSIQSVGVMIGGGLIWYKPEWKIIDLICTLIFSAIVLGTTIRMLRNILEVLMESTPREIDATRLEKGLCEMDEVVAIHELHIWAITVGKVLLACHVKVKPEADADMVLDKVIDYIKREYNISHVTIQIERDQTP
ncbi:Cation efflux family protein [Perilla frutescens var. frutescens]|nr:Cation efflux family protein [Perilla frutescens var. frutescens]